MDDKKRFSSVGFVLLSIFLLCALYSGIKWQPILGKFGMMPNGPTGLSLILFGGLFHLAGLGYTVFKAKDTPASILIGMFCAFWFYLGLGLMLYPSSELTASLIWIEPAMIVAIFFVAVRFYLGEKKALGLILTVGLCVIILMLWLSKLTDTIGKIENATAVFDWIARVYLPVLGVWALVLGLRQTEKAEVS
ncbi:MAG: hypothetical protein PHV78_01060 [Patescibacteria group bacterium]|nr:hypothetical protein [Patescibacteria group bacterium]MDD5121246.1 hypothetical protein [Patescibacteria group bacterium]MDD5222093.1 hypothetical protein [Patescibacteria group bacterium]MDD5395835.1 hypothetical protein [Patescibacteria group bacterium]